jgi:NAD(P)-dependent dehydrogenase (short-subunit alcohol dehydrogenase family)
MIDFREIDEKNDLKLNIVITGANSGIGYEAMRFLAVRGANILFGARSEAKADQAMQAVKATYKNPNIQFVPLDLASTKSIEYFKDAVKDHFKTIDILINNAGIMAVPYGKTPSGFEQQMGINHLGHYILTHHLLPSMAKDGRIINVSSQASLPGKIHWDDIFFENGGYTPFKSYAQSKLANLMFTEGLAKTLEDTSMKVITVHPGLARTGLFDRPESSRGFKVIFKLLTPFAAKPEKGARPTITAALSSEVQSGDFLGPKVRGRVGFISQEERKNPLALEPKYIQQFMTWSEKVTGLSFNA